MDALQNYLTTIGPVQIELTVERQFGAADDPLNAVMTQLGAAFGCFYTGEYGKGLAALRAARLLLDENARRGEG